MKEKKNIDRLFQEKFKDFEVQPNDRVWAAIAAQQNKKKKRVLPLWFQLSGAAAVLALLILAGGIWFNSDLNPKDQPVVEQNQNKQIDSLEEKDVYVNVPEVDKITEGKSDEMNSSTTYTEGIKNRNPKKTSNSSSRTTNQSKVANTINSKIEKLTTPSSKKANEDNSVQSSYANEALASETNDSKPEDFVQNPSENTANEAIVATSNSDTAIPENESEPEPEINANTLEEIANKTKTDALASADEEESNSENKRWGITPMIAPVYYNSFSGSGIDQQFSDNAKTADVNLSYGVQVSYAVSDRFTVRSGINKVDLGYNTEQIRFTPTINASSLRSSISSIDYNTNSQIIELGSIDKNSFAIPNSPGNQEFSSTLTNQSSSSLHQQLGYIEVPIEAEYALINKKIGLQVIGGVSSLFLNNNSISLQEGNNIVSELGKSNSLNSTSFSTNVGLGLDYKFTDQIQFNLEPMFKYQLNAYTKSVSDFKPYYLGLYTGISFKF